MRGTPYCPVASTTTRDCQESHAPTISHVTGAIDAMRTLRTRKSVTTFKPKWRA